MPILSSIAGAAAKAYGMMANAKRIITDNFGRTDGSLGTSSSGYLWSVLRGTWSISSNKATSSDAGSTYPLAIVDIGAQNVIVSADITDGGPGVAFWVTDANSWWASSVNYTSSSTQAYYTGSTVQTGTTTSCSGPGGNSSSGGGNCGTYVPATSGSLAYCTASTTYSCPSGCTPSGGACVIDGGPNEGAPCGPLLSNCNGPGGNGSTGGGDCGTCYSAVPSGVAYYTGSLQSVPVYSCSGPGGNSSSGGGDCGTYVPAGTTYSTELKLYKNVSGTISTVQTTNINSNGSAFVEANSIKAETQGDNITITAYQSSGLSSAFGTTLTNTPASPTKGTKAGIIKTSSSSNNGSLLDNFSAESV